MRIAIAALAFAVCACAPPATTVTDTRAALHEAAEAYEHAQIAGDANALQQIIADDYVLVGSDGARQNKQELVAFWTADGFDPAPVIVTEPIEHVWTDGAALGGTVTLTGTQNGEPFAVTLRYIDVWALRDGQWRVVYGQTTRMPAAN